MILARWTFFAVQTFTAGIYDVWLNMNNMAGAAQLAGVMMLFVFALIAMERLARRGRRFDTKPGRSVSQTQHLTGWPAAGALVACLLPVLLGFALPATMLSIDAVRFFDESFEAGFLTHAWHSLLISTIVALVSVALGLLLAYGVRLSGTRLMKTTSRIASIGYAVPGSVLAVGILYPLSQIDHGLNIMSKSLWGAPVGLLLSGTMFALVYGYTTRFMALSHGSVESGLLRITPNMEGAARSLGANRFETLKRIHLPLLRGSLANRRPHRFCRQHERTAHDHAAAPLQFRYAGHPCPPICQRRAVRRSSAGITGHRAGRDLAGYFIEQRRFQIIKMGARE